jgi:hypothetical protein
MTRDLFGNCDCGNPIDLQDGDLCSACYRAQYTKLAGLQVKLDRPIDRERPCCNNICIIRPGKEPHAAELRCAGCGQHRGWLSKPTARWIEHVFTRFGAPVTPVIVWQSTLEQEESEFCTHQCESADAAIASQTER